MSTPTMPPTSSPAPETLRTNAIPFRFRSAIAVTLVSVAGLMAFAWPLIVEPSAGFTRSTDAPMIFTALIPLLLAVVMVEMSEGGFDVKAVALLGVLSAVGAALRPIGAGTAGLETVFFLLVLAGRVLGPGFGFVLGTTTLFSSALLTGGVGYWLPFQMIGAAWVGLGAGLLPRARGRLEIVLLAAYGAVAGLAYGWLLNLMFWPVGLGGSTGISYVPGAPVGENLHRFMLFNLTTSLGWDIGRAVTNAVLIAVTGASVLRTLRRAARKAAFTAQVTFTGTAATAAEEHPGKGLVGGGGST